MQTTTQKLNLSTRSATYTLPTTLLLLGLMVLLLTLKLETYPAPWFDEGYSTNTAMTLVDTGIYGTRSGDTIVEFDPGTSTGSTVILPIALAYKLVGPGVLPARLVIVAFALVGIFALYQLTRLMYRGSAALLIVLGIMAIPLSGMSDYFSLGRQVLGEVPAFALIMLSIWVWARQWNDPKAAWNAGILGGILCGLGLIAKLQVTLAIAPAVGLITLARFILKKQGISVFAYGLMTTVMIGAWMLIQRVLITPEQQAANSQMLATAVDVLFFSGLSGRPLPNTAYPMITIMVVGLVITGIRIARRPAGQRLQTTAHWVEALLMITVLGAVLWYALLSSGWPRYAFFGVTIALILIGRTAFSVLQMVEQRTKFQLYWLTAALLIVGTVVLKVAPILQDTNSQQADLAAAYIQENIPSDARIETFEWYLDVMAPDNTFEHPNTVQQYITLKAFIETKEWPMGDYSEQVTASSPDYLVIGPFAGFTGVYPATLIESQFSEIAHVGEFFIYERRP